MDPDVVKALARWPNVPSAYGWLSLTRRGQWRFHPGGRAAEGGPGEPISNERITAFINRNFTHDASGHWFFQNGPQKAFVRLDAAPFVMRYSSANDAWVTHTGEACGAISHWWLDESGRLFASTQAGPAIVDDRELMGVLDDMALQGAQAADTSASFLEVLAELPLGDSLSVIHRFAPDPIPLTRIDADALPARLHFVSCPMPQEHAGAPDAK